MDALREHLREFHNWSALAIQAIGDYHASLQGHSHHIGFFCVHRKCHQELDNTTHDMTKEELITHYHARHSDSHFRRYYFLAMARTLSWSSDGPRLTYGHYSTEDALEAFDGLFVELSVQTSYNRHVLAQLRRLDGQHEQCDSVQSHPLPLEQTEEPKTRDPTLTQNLQTLLAMIDTESAIFERINSRAPIIYTDCSKWLRQRHARVEHIDAAIHLMSSHFRGEDLFRTVLSSYTDARISRINVLIQAIGSRILSINQGFHYLLQTDQSDGSVRRLIKEYKIKRDTSSILKLRSEGLAALAESLLLRGLQEMQAHETYLLELSKQVHGHGLTMIPDQANVMSITHTPSSQQTHHHRAHCESHHYSTYPLFHQHMKEAKSSSLFKCFLCPHSGELSGEFTRLHFQRDHAQHWLQTLGDDLEFVSDAEPAVPEFATGEKRLRWLTVTALRRLLPLSRHELPQESSLHPHEAWTLCTRQTLDCELESRSIPFNSLNTQTKLLAIIKRANVLTRFALAKENLCALDAVLAAYSSDTSRRLHEADPTSLRQLENLRTPSEAAIDTFSAACHKLVILNQNYFKLLYDLAREQLEVLQKHYPADLDPKAAEHIQEELDWISLQLHNRLAYNAQSKDHYHGYHHEAYHRQVHDQIATISVILKYLHPFVLKHQHGASHQPPLQIPASKLIPPHHHHHFYSQ